MALDQAHGIILKSQKFRESSKILRVFTEEYGTISLIAKGVRGPKSKTAGLTEVLNHVVVSFYRKPGQDLYLLKQVDIQDAFSGLRAVYEGLTVALAVTEVVYRITIQEAAHAELFADLLQALQSLDAGAKRPLNYYWAFLLSVQHTFGCGMTVDQCSVSGQALPEGSAAFHLDYGGTIDAENSDAATADARISPESRWVIHYLQNNTGDRLDRLAPSEPCRKEINTLLHRYMRYHIEGFSEPQSLKLLTTNRPDPTATTRSL
jgi:DNA repair protein RecO (recombination protein O)